MKVRNINGTSDNKCKCGDWLKHWQKYGGGITTILTSSCSVQGCMSPAQVGAHVQKDGLGGFGADEWYIVPMCRSHNAQKGGALIIDDSVKLVSANVSKTCG